MESNPYLARSKPSQTSPSPRPPAPFHLLWGLLITIIVCFRRLPPHCIPSMHSLTTSVLGTSVSWSPNSLQTFQQVKDALSQARLLYHPVPYAPLAIRSDASDVGVDAILEQLMAGDWLTLGFFSWGLTSTECCYSVFHWELLATYAATRHFQSSIEGQRSSLFTNHHPLAQVVRCSLDPWSPWQQRYLSILAEFLADFLYLLASSNAVADALSLVASIYSHFRVAAF